MNRGNHMRKSKSGRILMVQRHIVQQSYNALHEHCDKGLESVVYWYGLELHDLNTDIVVAVAIPNADLHNMRYEVSAEEAARMGKVMMTNSLVCLAQIHTHPGKDTNHSRYDDLNSISTRNGFLSLVAPNYGCRLDLGLDKVSVHEAWDARWYQLARPARKQRIRIIEDLADLRTGE